MQGDLSTFTNILEGIQVVFLEGNKTCIKKINFHTNITTQERHNTWNLDHWCARLICQHDSANLHLGIGKTFSPKMIQDLISKYCHHPSCSLSSSLFKLYFPPHCTFLAWCTLFLLEDWNSNKASSLKQKNKKNHHPEGAMWRAPRYPKL